MEVYLAKHINKSAGDEDLSSALLMGDLDAFKQRLHILAKEDGDWIYNIPSDKNMLHEACEHGNLDIVKFLIENGADINLKDSWVYTPLLYAVYHDHLTVARYLIDKGAITTYRTLDGHRYSEWATDRDLIKLLEQHENK